MNNDTGAEEVVPGVPDTQHEPHPHASKRVVVGVVAVIVVFVLGGIIWSHWGERIEQVCFGDDEACEVETPTEFVEGFLRYDTEAFGDVTE